MKILAISDVELGYIYNPQIAQRFKNVDVVISCGDLPHYYLEYIVSTLDKPLYYVFGNHSNQLEGGSGGDRSAPWGAVNIHQRAVRDQTGLLLAGLEGSLRYNNGPCQYTQSEYWQMAYLLALKLLLNRLRLAATWMSSSPTPRRRVSTIWMICRTAVSRLSTG